MAGVEPGGPCLSGYRSTSGSPVSSLRRRGQLALAGLLAVLTSAGGLGNVVWLQVPDEPRVETDSQLMEQTRVYLREVEVELRDLHLR